MKKQQYIVLGSGALLFCLIYFFGRTIPERTKTTTQTFDFNAFLVAQRSKLSVEQQGYVTALENAVVRGNVGSQRISVYRQMADFWKDSAHQLTLYGHYLGEAAKLENIEKSLTFAGQIILEGMRRQSDLPTRKWMAGEAKEIFEKALTLNPANDSTKVGLGACFLFGQLTDNPMQGIQLIKEVADRDSTNAYAQLILGIGGMESGQLDRSIERFKKVLAQQPNNLEAILALAECYERTGDKAHAIEWYTKSKSFFNEQEILQEIDARIDLLKK